MSVDLYGRVSVLDTSGRRVAGWGGSAPGTVGGFTAPHGIAVDSRGDIYVAEVTHFFGVKHGVAPADAPTLQKLALRSDGALVG
jgi:hypothetical protein